MSCYRLYFLHPASGHIVRFAEYEAPGDAAAVAHATEHEGAHPLELWCQHRKVKRFEQVASGAVGLERKAGANASFEISRRSFSPG